MKAVFRRSRAMLVPVDDEGIALLERLRRGQDVMVDVRTARNILHHRLFFAILNKLVENTDFFVGIEDALRAVKIGCQLVDTVIDDTGKVYYILRSIAFESMDQTEFSTLFDAAIKLVCNRWLVGTKEEDLRDEVFKMCDAPTAIGRRVR
jgi:hypothetical protein